MKAFILDTTTIIWAPNIFTHKYEAAKIIIASSSIDEIKEASKKFPSFKQTLDLIEKSKTEGIVEIYNVIGIESSKSISLPGDSYIVNLALKIKKDYKKVSIISGHQWIIREAEKASIGIVNKTELDKFIISGSALTLNLFSLSDNIKRNQRLSIIVSVLVSSISAILIFFNWVSIVKCFSQINIIIIIVLIILFPMLVYWLRGRVLLFYSLLEILVGLVAMLKVFMSRLDFSTIDGNSVLQLLAGIYITVRGQDNLGKYLKYTKFRDFWEKYSGIKY